MAQLCNHCGKSFESTATVCPYCQASLSSQLPALGSPAATDNGLAREDSDQVQVVTAPVRKKRSLPKSCMMGFLIFAPTIFLVVFLMYFYFRQNRLREEQDLRRTPIVDKANTEKILSKLSEAMEPWVLEARPELIVSVKAESQEALTITVKPEWNDLLEGTRKDLEERWLNKWHQLDGKTLKINVAENSNPSVKGQ